MKNILITGAGDGVGKAVAELLKNENLILVDIDKANVEMVAKQLQKHFVCDITNESRIKDLEKFVKSNFEKLDCLINCAGVWTKGEISQLSDESILQKSTH